MHLIYYRFLIITVFVLLNFTFVSGQAVIEENANLDFSKIKNQEIIGTFGNAKAYNKLILLIFDATWCPYCKRLNEETLQNDKVLETVSSFEKLNVDIDKNPEDAELFKGKPRGSGGNGIPAIVIFSSEGKELDRITGFIEAKEFNLFLRKQLKKQKEANLAP